MKTRTSPDPTEVFTPADPSINSDSELETISSLSEWLSSDEDAEMNDFNAALHIFESRLLSVLRHDLPLAAELIPQVYHQVQSWLATRTGPANNDTPSDGNGGTSGPHPAHSDSSRAPSSPANNGMDSRPRKHRRGSDQDDDQDGGSPKRSRIKLPNEHDGPLKFACHFHKRNSSRYNPHTNPKYLHCICPLKTPELRRIKYIHHILFVPDLELIQ